MTINLNEARVTLVSALAWRVVAELFRRHREKHRLVVLQDHPGSSMRGRLLVVANDGGPASPCLALNLGGGISGTWQVVRGFGLGASVVLGSANEFAAGLLGPSPASVIDAICCDWGLPQQTGKLPLGDATTLAARVIAGLLERHIAEVHPWRTTSGFAYSSMGPIMASWTSMLTPDGADMLIESASSRYVLLHRADDEQNVLDRSVLQGVGWLFDLATGNCIAVSRNAVADRIALPQAYHDADRNMHALLRVLESAAATICPS